MFDCHSLRSGFLLMRVRLTACLCLTPLASLGILLLGIRLAAFFINRCLAIFCALSFAVVFSVVGSLYRFRFSFICFCWGRFCIASAGASPSGTRQGFYRSVLYGEEVFVICSYALDL